MKDLLPFIATVFGIAIGVALVVILIAQYSKRVGFVLVRIVLTTAAVWSLCTSWMWFYAMATYLSLPVLFLGITLLIYSIKKMGWLLFNKISAGILIAAAMCNLACYLWWFQ
ncbi:hypothetical protein [Nonlabens xiamenensis]|uniref:hypothetical protein n=1 Tax=Nonlabens xiamenensis TaxID=2341043 RepID=UPI000F615803|nr:hypothetical protein [Nonlabens xiamenensis]